jgi:hypothetical protein
MCLRIQFYIYLRSGSLHFANCCTLMYMVSYLDPILTSAVNCRRWRRPTPRCRPSSPEAEARKVKLETGRPGPMLSFTKTFRSPYIKSTIIFSIDTNPCSVRRVNIGLVEAVYIEHQSICPFVGTGPPPPPQASVSPPLDPKGGATFPCG